MLGHKMRVDALRLTLRARFGWLPAVRIRTSCRTSPAVALLLAFRRSLDPGVRSTVVPVRRAEAEVPVPLLLYEAGHLPPACAMRGQLGRQGSDRDRTDAIADSDRSS